MHKWFPPTPDDGPDKTGDSTAPWVLWALPIAAVPAVPGLVWMAAERPMAARIPLALGMTMGVAIVALLVMAAISRGFRHRLRWSAAVAATVTLMLFMWPQLTFVGHDLEKSLPLGFLSDAVPVLIAGSMIWLSIRMGHESKFAVILGVGVVAAVLVLANATIPYVETTPVVAAGTPAADAPDVLLIVLDGYGRTDNWQEILGFDNTSFEEDLADLGFTVATEARANYGITFASLSAMFALDYVFDVGEITDADHVAMRTNLSGNGALMNEFRSAGYEVAYIENAWQGSSCGPGVDICFRDGLGERVIWNLGEISIFAPLSRATRIHPFNTVSGRHLESLAEYVDTDRSPGVPRLMIAHLLLPHPPFHLDAECNLINTESRTGFRSANAEEAELRKGYLSEQALCTNSMLLEELEQILGDREDTLIMITGDHGSETALLENPVGDPWDDDDILDERMAILSAYRMPGCESRLYPTMSPVNGTRALTSCALGVDLPKIEDRTLWTPELKGEVIDISARISP